MSNIAVQGGAGGTGTVTLLAPSTSTDRVLTLPDSTGTVATAESTLSQFNASGSAPVYAARAWVNFNGTGTVAIRASGNVSSLTDVGVGEYRVNFTTALPDANYTVTTGVSESGIGGVARVAAGDGYTTTYALLITLNTSTRTDFQYIQAAIFR